MNLRLQDNYITLYASISVNWDHFIHHQGLVQKLNKNVFLNSGWYQFWPVFQKIP